VAERRPIGDRIERSIEQRTELDQELAKAETPPPRRLRRTIFWLGITGVSLYLVAPSLLDVFGSWRNLRDLGWWWLLAMAALQALTLACVWVLQHLAIHVASWRAVVTSQLAGNALGKIAPAGGAIGAALQYRLLVTAGTERSRAVAGITATNLLTFAVVLALPVLAVPALLRGSVDRGLVEATIIGLVVFIALASLSAILLAMDRPLAFVGRVVQRVRNRLRRRHAEPVHTLPQRLIRERDRILRTIGPRWQRALVATVARWAFDYATLLAALAAVGSHPRPALVLLAFCGAQVLSQIPVTPGGLGFVEAGLTALLKLAGVATGDAVLATFTYRLFSYWLPLPAGAVAYALHRRRYG
jgi:uncharacterized protein (TIRG00374 family)